MRGCDNWCNAEAYEGRSNQAMQRTAGRIGSALSMKFHGHPSGAVRRPSDSGWGFRRDCERPPYDVHARRDVHSPLAVRFQCY